MQVIHQILAALPPTKTYKKRAFLFQDQTELFKGDDRDATVVIMQAKSEKEGAKFEEDGYAIEEREPQPGVMGRQFLMLNETSETADVYEVTIGHPVDSCTCDGHRAGKARCKHIATLAAVIAAGGLPVRKITCGMGI